MAFSTNSGMNTARSFVTPQVDSQYLDFDFFAKRPELLPTVYRSWDNKGFVDMLALTGREELLLSENFSNYEEGLLPRSFSIATVANATAGGADITLTADSLSTVNTLTGPQVFSPLMENATIKFPNRKEGFVKVKSNIVGNVVGPATAAITYTIVKSNLADDTSFDLGAYLTSLAGTGQRLTAPMTAFAEGSYEALEGVENPIIRFVGETQIIKSFSEITQSAAGDIFDVDFGGGAGKYWYSKQRLDQGLNHRTMEGVQLVVGRGGRFSDKNNKVVKTTMGLEGYVRAYGNVYDYPSTGITAADLTALVSRIKSIWGGSEYQWIMGSVLYSQVAALIRSLPGLQGGAIRYDMFGKSDAKQKALDLGINSIVWDGVTIHMQESPIFDHPELLGIAGYNYQNQGIMFPGGTTRVTSDNGRGEPMNFEAESLRIRYKQGVNGQSRRYQEYNRDAKQHGYDVDKFNMLSHIGLQMVGLRRFILTQKGA